MKLPLLTLGKTVFVTLLMIGIAMGQSGGGSGTVIPSSGYLELPAGHYCRWVDGTITVCPNLFTSTVSMAPTAKPKPAKPPAKKADQHEANYKLFDAGYAYGRVSALTLLINSGSNTEELCSELKGADWWADLAKKSGFNESLLEGHEGVDSAREYCRERMPIGDISNGTPLPYMPASSLLHPPLDVPAIRKTRIVGVTRSDCPPLPDGTHGKSGQECYIAPTPPEIYFTCPDPDAYSLQISVSQKNANCHRITP